MSLHPLAGKKTRPDMLINVPRLVSAYYTHRPDPSDPEERVLFGTSGHRGSSTRNSFTESHILAICQAISEHRRKMSISGPLFVGMDTHALSEPALATAAEVFAANEISIRIQEGMGYTPTPVVSHAVLTFNRTHGGNAIADGVIITPSHNPPEDGGFKYNPPHGGPAGTETTVSIQERANQILESGLADVKRISLRAALQASTTEEFDFVEPYVRDLNNVVDMQAIARSKLKIGVDSMGGSGIAYWEPIAERYNLDIEVANPVVDPTFSFMTVDRDGKIRMDCSSPHAMAGLIALRDRFDIAFGNDPDYDRHGIVTRGAGLLNPNHYLAASINYLFSNRPNWPASAAVGKTLVSSKMIDRVAASLNRRLVEVPVGFKWFVDGLQSGEFGFAGEESAGASFLRFDGGVWTTDKDGIIMDLLAAEICARTEKDPAEHYAELESRFGSPCYARHDQSATPAQKEILQALSPEDVPAETLGGEKLLAKITRAGGNNEKIGGLKVITDNCWFAARPSGTEDVYKIYAESFNGEAHLLGVVEEAQKIVDAAFKKA